MKSVFSFILFTLLLSSASAQTPQLIQDINPGINGSYSPDNAGMNYAVYAGEIYFAASSASGNTELWKSNGTNSGTVLVKEINPTS